MRHVDDVSRREQATMTDASNVVNPEFELPELHAIKTRAADLSNTSPSERTVALGGVAVPKVPSFSVSTRLRNRDVIEDTDLNTDEILEVLDTAARLKKMQKRGEPHPYLAGKTLGLLFQHPSTRTRVSFEAGIAQLGGQAIFMGVNDLQMKRGETLADTAQVLSRYVDAIVARVADHNDLLTLADFSSIPVMNGLSDKSHPLQALADMLTLKERFGDLHGLKLAYLGDGNNMACSLMIIGAAMGISVSVAAPTKYQPHDQAVSQAAWFASANRATIMITDDPYEAVKDADAIYTDVHVSMGMTDGAQRAVSLAPYKVTQELMSEAKSGAIFMHCLPMHRDEEVAADVADGKQSIIFDQAENRLHLQKALLLQTMI
jgi:ornithine carbamoyltransferase